MTTQRLHRPILSALLPIALSVLLPSAAQAPRSRPPIVTISPLNGTIAALPGTQISFLGARARDLAHIAVVGSKTGLHAGRLRSYVSALGASFVVKRPFAPGEHVSVRATLREQQGRRRSLTDSFTVAVPVAVSHEQFPTTPGTAADVQSFASEPGVHPPTVTIDQASGPSAPAPGYLFAAPFQGPGQYGPMIFDNAGHMVWFRPVPPGQDAADFKVQRYRSKNVLTWWQGHTISLGFGLGEDVIANSAYRTIAVVRAGNGLQADEHEFTVLGNGAALITAYSPVKADLSSAGGTRNGIAVDCAVQEIDIRTGLVMWEWHALGNVGVAESYSKAPTEAGTPYDYFHLNSVEVLPDGDFLVSARNTWGVYKLDHHSGAIAWRLGGKRSSFALGKNVQFAYQHDARMLSSGQLSVFDDEGTPQVAPPARGEIVNLDTKAHRATLAQSFVRTSGPLQTGSQGDVQLLADGNRMIGWGGDPNFTEFDPSGRILFDGQFPAGEMSYRVYRYPWRGRPGEAPAIAASTQRASEPACAHPKPGEPACLAILSRPQTKVYMSWNGATEVASWRVLAGPSRSKLSPAASVAKTGFQTSATIPAAAYVQAQALDAHGKVLASSRAIK
jgi:Arylsulfotransferase (ASST)